MTERAGGAPGDGPGEEPWDPGGRSRPCQQWGAAALWLVHVAITSALACYLSIWTDEAFSLNTTSGGAWYALRQSLSFEQQPPIYFLVLWLWRQVSAGPIWARFFSVLCAALAVRLTVPLARRYAPGLGPAWTMALCGLHPYVICAAVNTRLYALALLLSALLFLLFHDAYLVDPPGSGRGKGRARLLHGLCAGAALGTQYFLGSLLLAGGVALLLLRRRAALKAYVHAMVAVGLCFLPLAIEVPRQIQGHTGAAPERLSLLGAVLTVYRCALRLLYEPEALEGAARIWAPRLLLAALALLLVRRLRQRERGPLPAPQAALLIGVAVAALCFVPVAVLLGEHLRYRHLVALLVPMLLATLALLGWASRRERAGWLLVSGALYAASLVHNYGPNPDRTDWRRIGAYLTASAAPGEPILVFIGAAALPLAIHYHGPSPIVPLPEENRFDRYDERRFVVRSAEALRRRIAEGAGDPPRLWLVTEPDCSWMPKGECGFPVLEAYFAEHYHVEREVRFPGAKVRLLRRMRDGADAELTRR